MILKNYKLCTETKFSEKNIEAVLEDETFKESIKSGLIGEYFPNINSGNIASMMTIHLDNACFEIKNVAFRHMTYYADLTIFPKYELYFNVNNSFSPIIIPRYLIDKKTNSIKRLITFDMIGFQRE